jgi:hypothetical protein
LLDIYLKIIRSLALFSQSCRSFFTLFTGWKCP